MYRLVKGGALKGGALKGGGEGIAVKAKTKRQKAKTKRQKAKTKRQKPKDKRQKPKGKRRKPKDKRLKSYGEGGGLSHARGNDNEYVTQSNDNSFIII